MDQLNLEIYNFNIQTIANNDLIFDGFVEVKASWEVKGRLKYSKDNLDSLVNTTDKTINLTSKFLYLTKDKGEYKCKDKVAGQPKQYILRYYIEPNKEQGNSTWQECYEYSSQGYSLKPFLPQCVDSENIWFYCTYEIESIFLPPDAYDLEYGLYVGSNDLSSFRGSVSTTKKVRRVMELTKDKILINSPMVCDMQDGWYNNNSSGINLNNNDIVKVNGIYFNEDDIDNIGEGIHFYHPVNSIGRDNFDILYGKEGRLHYVSNPSILNNLTSNLIDTGLNYVAPETIILNSNLSFSGHITSSGKNLFFLIPLTRPITDYTRIILSGAFIVRGTKGYVGHPDMTSNSYLYNSYGVRMMINNSNTIHTTDTEDENEDDYIIYNIPLEQVELFITPCGLQVKITAPKVFKNVDNNTPLTISPVASLTGQVENSATNTDIKAQRLTITIE